MRRFVLLPGLDGTGELFEPFLSAAPPNVRWEVIKLPSEPLDYPKLFERIAPTVQLTADTVVLAESFSGPLAIMLAEGRNLAALILCNTFVIPPRAQALRHLASPLLFRVSPPTALVRHLLVGSRAPEALVAKVCSVLSSVPAGVLAARVKSVLSVAVADRLVRCAMPILYLRGTEDRLVPEASLDAIVAEASGPVTVARIAGPHLLLQAEPDAAWRAIATAVLPPAA
jgi:pimeloyl-ACP methyl ester carboxylesterase